MLLLDTSEASKLMHVSEQYLRRLIADGRILATDVRHGGLGNFVELLNICLNIAGDGEVSRDVLRNAMKYKLMPR